MARNAPAFQLYVDDFLGGTISMSAEEVGVYIRLLCIQWSAGVVTQRDINVMNGSTEAKEYVVSQKFVSVDGGFRNERLEAVRKAMEIRRSNASKGGSKSASKRASDRASTRQVAGQVNPQVKPQVTGVVKPNPPTPSPTPTPSSSSLPIPISTSEGERKPSPSLDSVHFLDSDFRNAWDAWTAKIGSNVNAVTLQAQLDLLRDETTAEATAMVWFSVSRTHCRNLITDGSHRKKLKQPADAKGGWDD